MMEPVVLVLVATAARTLVQLARVGVALARDRALRRRMRTLTALAGPGGVVLDRHPDGTTLVLIGDRGESR